MPKTKEIKEENKEEKTENKSIWRIYNVELQFRDLLVGGVPKNPDVVKSWIDSRAVELDRAEKDKAILDTLEDIEQSEEKAWCGFKTTPESVPYIEERHIKAMLKEAAGILKLRFKATIAKGVFVKPEKLLLPKELFTMERVIHVSDRQGKRSALKKSDYVVKPKINFNLWVSAVDIKPKDLKQLFEAGGEIGVGADRTLGYGKFDFTLSEAKETSQETNHSETIQ